MFHGSIPADMRSVVIEQAKAWPANKPIYIGCSGNFTIERVLNDLGRPLHSNDVTGYSTALGMWLAEGKVPFELKREYRSELEWLLPYLETDQQRLASIMLGTTFLTLVKSEKAYQRRLLDAYVRQFPNLHARTMKRLSELPVKLASYSPMDVREWVENVVPKDAPVVMYPPFYAGDYEQQFEPIDHFFDWPKPDYPELDEDGKDELVKLVTGRPNWLMGLHVKRKELTPYMRGSVQTTNRGVPIYVYGSGGNTRIVRPAQKLEFLNVPKIGFNEDLEGPLKLVVLTGGQFQALRSQFMSKTILPGQPLMGVGVMAGSKLIGSFAFGSQTQVGVAKDNIYLLSDFPVSWSKYRHLAKLIVMAAMSKESQALAQRSTSRRINTIETTAFSNRPVSMKYRGPMKLKTRKEGDDGYHKYKLQYRANMGELSLEETLEKGLNGPGKALRDHSTKGKK